MARLSDENQTRLDEGSTIAVLWHVEDIEQYAINADLKISHDQAIDILQGLNSNLDGEYGITWDSIDAAIRFESTQHRGS